MIEIRPNPFVDGIVWPSVPSPRAAGLMAMLFELEQSQWLSPELLRRRQFEQAAALLRHASANVPFYRERLRGVNPDALDEQAWRALPILERGDIQSHSDALKSATPPTKHGKVLVYRSSGSSGQPITVLGSDITHFFWLVLSIRDHLWHRRDFSAKHGSIRSKVESGASPNWAPWGQEIRNGPSCALNIRADIDAQLDWLAAESPAYLLTHPSNLRALALRALERGVKVAGLRELRTFGEMLAPDLRGLCREAWGLELKDMYSAEEVGYIALQCPDHEHYHVQAENLLVEVLDAKGEPCGPGQVGSVVVTTLHNFVMPLIRYRLRDFAEVGPPCACGRGLPVLKRVVGRQRNMLTLPDGHRHWPSFPVSSWNRATPAVRQFQIVQHDLNRIEVRLVCARPLSQSEEAALAAMLTEELGHPFQFDFTYLERIETTPNNKYEDFVSRLES